MAEYWFYLTIKIVCCTYILYKVWGWNKKIREVYKVLYRPKTNFKQDEHMIAKVPEPDIIGSTHHTYLNKNAGQIFTPILNEQSKIIPVEETEEDELLPEEVAYNLSMDLLKIIGEEQAELDALPRNVEAFTTQAVSIDELLLAGDVLMGIDGSEQDERKQLQAAQTLHRIQGTDLFDIFILQMENVDIINNLIDKYLDENGEPREIKLSEGGKQPLKSWRSLI